MQELPFLLFSLFREKLHHVGAGTKDNLRISRSTCLDSSERRAFDLDCRDPGFNTHQGNIILIEFFLFSRCKASNAHIAILTISCVCENLDWQVMFLQIKRDHVHA